MATARSRAAISGDFADRMAACRFRRLDASTRLDGRGGAFGGRRRWTRAGLRAGLQNATSPSGWVGWPFIGYRLRSDWCALGGFEEIDVVCDVAEEFVGFLFLFEDGIERGGVPVPAEDFGPGAQGAINGDLVMFDLLSRSDE